MPDISNKIYQLDAHISPFTALLTTVGKSYDGKSWQGTASQKKMATNYEFKCLEGFFGGRYCKVSGTYTTGAVTITVTGAGSSSAYIFTPGDIVMNARTGERFKVDTVASATTITVAAAYRGLGTSSDIAGADGDELYIIGNSNEESASARNINVARVGNQTNYTLIKIWV